MTTGIVYDIKKYSIHDGPGIRTTFHLKGCPLSCWWCHNPESQSLLPVVLYRKDRCIGCGRCVESCPHKALSFVNDGVHVDLSRCVGCGVCASVCPSLALELVGRTMTVPELVAEARKDELFYDQSGGGVTFSGGEPLMQPEFLLEVLEACGAAGFHRAVDTCGFAPEETILRVARHTDLFLYDLKHMDPEAHRLYTGVDNVLILSNLRRLDEAGARLNIRVPLIPGINDSPENLDALGRFVASLNHVAGLNLLPYHTAGRSKYPKWGMTYRLEETPPPTEHQVRVAAEALRRQGLEVTIGG